MSPTDEYRGLATRVSRLEEDVRKAFIAANEAKQAASDFRDVVTAHVDKSMRHISGELATLKTDNTGQQSTLDMQTQQLKTIESKVDNVIHSVEQKRTLEIAEEAVVKKYDERIRRIAATIGLVSTAAAAAGWLIHSWR